MRCTVCGGELTPTQTDLPFKVGETSIVILRSLPVLQCIKCPEYLIEDEVLGRIDQILEQVGTGTEVEIIRYAA
jgi:YgiT-type zinc finger domain-containing protein